MLCVSYDEINTDIVILLGDQTQQCKVQRCETIGFSPAFLPQVVCLLEASASTHSHTGEWNDVGSLTGTLFLLFTLLAALSNRDAMQSV